MAHHMHEIVFGFAQTGRCRKSHAALEPQYGIFYIINGSIFFLKLFDMVELQNCCSVITNAVPGAGAMERIPVGLAGATDAQRHW